ncbi:helix-turn-helix domain-containing protein [Burkholderia metallica]|uniref:AraC family transcriptional regulator n=1 Tax=Burkholderia metallica TaxID=488729 RepID=UPI00157B5A42|nr:AraC family transcriptional regulator [Burkholderia metallica]NTZ83611.1 helix-turn-helix domain-containing protein [Burkholderia metallica]
MSDILTFSTDQIESEDRLEFWLSELARPMLLSDSTCRTSAGRVRLDSPPLQRAGFHGRSSVAAFAEIAVFEMNTAALSARVDQADSDLVERFPYILVFNPSESMDSDAFTEQANRRIPLGPGSATLLDFRRLLEMSSGSEDWHRIYVGLPERLVESFIPRADDLVSIEVEAARGWGKILSSYLSNISPSAMSTLGRSQAMRTLLGEHITSLLGNALLEIGSGTPQNQYGPQHARRVELLAAIRKRLRDDLSNDVLSAASVADEFGISSRTLHRLFAEDGTGSTFLGDLNAMRVELARRMLSDPRFDNLTVAEIGRRCGFNEVNTFIRVFRQRTATSPQQFRKVGDRG